MIEEESTINVTKLKGHQRHTIAIIFNTTWKPPPIRSLVSKKENKKKQKKKNKRAVNREV